MVTKVAGTPILAMERERPDLVELDALFHEHSRGLKLVDQHGEQVDLPETARRLFHEVAHALAEGNPVAVRVLPHELTIRQAADLLDVPVSHVMDLIERADILTVADKPQEIRSEDLLAYKERRDADRRAGLAELTRLSQEMGLYGPTQSGEDLPPVESSHIEENHPN